MSEQLKKVAGDCCCLVETSGNCSSNSNKVNTSVEAKETKMVHGFFCHAY
jgi:hypothetical protein